MYKYKLGFIELEHTKKFTEEEIIKLISEIVYEEYLKLTPGEKPELRFQEFFYHFKGNNLKEKLIKNCGFKEITFDLVFSLFGWAKIMDKTHWKDERGDLDKITNYIEEKEAK